MTIKEKEKADMKIKLWDLIEKSIPNASDNVGWGSMDRLCDDIVSLVSYELQEELNHCYKNLNG
jgi:hypothetical protein